MKLIKIAFFSLFLSSCQNDFQVATKDDSSKKIKCRITYYHPYQDKWGSQVACPKTKRAKKGVTVAAHPDFKFGQKVFIPKLKGIVGDGYFFVQDRGCAVTKKVASRKKSYVFDVFVNSGSELRKYVKKVPPYMDVYIH